MLVVLPLYPGQTVTYMDGDQLCEVTPDVLMLCKFYGKERVYETSFTGRWHLLSTRRAII
jgi:hypothetical protein